MIAHLKGVLLHQSEMSLIIDVSGVGYEVHVASDVVASSKGIGKEIELFIFTDVKENDISLFGFASLMERRVFLLVKKVKGFGSKLALSVLSSIGAEGVLQCIGREDVQALTRVPGVGKKTAERLIVELREQVAELLPDASREYVPSKGAAKAEQASGPGHLAVGPVQDAMLALEKLGFSSIKAKMAVEAVLEDEEQAEGMASQSHDASTLLRSALGRL